MERLATDFKGLSKLSLEDQFYASDDGDSSKEQVPPGIGAGSDGSGDNGSGDDIVQSSNMVEFDEAALEENRIFGPEAYGQIKYKVKDEVEFMAVTLLANEAINANNANTKKKFNDIGKASYGQKERTPKFEDPFTSVNSTHLSLDVTSAEFKDYYGSQMYIRIDWQSDSLTGDSWSTYFTVENKTLSGTDAEQKRNSLLEESQKDYPESIYEETASTFSPTRTSAGNRAPTGQGGEGGLSSQPASSNSDDDHSGGGMSTGAKAGAAVGGVLGGLLIIGAIVWFLLRRRRQKKTFVDDNAGEQAYVMDKETRARTTDSPNTPYTDGGQVKPIALESINREGEDSAAPRTSLGSHGRGGNSGVQTPQGVSSNVAHLVEDGMTADEIRRLEEEERQLDDEIERAARR